MFVVINIYNITTYVCNVQTYKPQHVSIHIYIHTINNVKKPCYDGSPLATIGKASARLLLLQ